MRVFIASTSTNNVDVVTASLKFLFDPMRPHTDNFSNIEIFRYDARYREAATQAVMGNPEAQARLQAGQLQFPRERVSMDKELLDAARDFKPDVILYIGCWEGAFMPSDETLAELNKIAPNIHVLFDAADSPWWTDCGPERGNIIRYHKNDCFALTVCLDGAAYWPGHPSWNDEATRIGPSITALTPMDPRFFMAPPSEMAFRDRPIAIGYAGNAGGWVRSLAVQRLQSYFGPKGLLSVKLRDDNPNSYKQFADFLRYSRVVINIPFTGSGAYKHVKGRAVEAGYAGCALLEWKNDATRQWLVPRYEFMEYESIEEMIELAEWMAGHTQFCAEMGFALRSKMVNAHSPLAFWSKVFGAVGLEPFKIRNMPPEIIPPAPPPETADEPAPPTVTIENVPPASAGLDAA